MGAAVGCVIAVPSSESVQALGSICLEPLFTETPDTVSVLPDVAPTAVNVVLVPRWVRQFSPELPLPLRSTTTSHSSDAPLLMVRVSEPNVMVPLSAEKV